MSLFHITHSTLKLSKIKKQTWACGQSCCQLSPSHSGKPDPGISVWACSGQLLLQEPVRRGSYQSWVLNYCCHIPLLTLPGQVWPTVRVKKHIINPCAVLGVPSQIPRTYVPQFLSGEKNDLWIITAMFSHKRKWISSDK